MPCARHSVHAHRGQGGPHLWLGEHDAAEDEGHADGVDGPEGFGEEGDPSRTPTTGLRSPMTATEPALIDARPRYHAT